MAEPQPGPLWPRDPRINDPPVRDLLRDLPFDFSRPSPSLQVSGTWPGLALYGPDYAGIWGALYGVFDLDSAITADPEYPPDYWRHYPHFNVGFFYYHSARQFGVRFAEYAYKIRDRDLPELAC